MKSETIKAIFTNFLFVIGVVLIIVGASRGILTVVRLAVFDKYPLDYYAETRCAYPPVPVQDGEVMPKLEAECTGSLDYERRLRLTDDIVNSTTMLISGLVLTFSFKRFIFGKKVSH